MKLPDEIRSFVQSSFSDQSAYGQIATVDAHLVPFVRTMHIHMHPNQEDVVLSSNTLSEKWTHLTQNPFFSGCYWDKEKGIQFRFQAKATLCSEQNTCDDPLLIQMWQSMRPQVRLAYALYDSNIPMYKKEVDVDMDAHSSHHGIIIGQVFRWDVFFEDPLEYRFGKRHIYTLHDQNLWVKKDVSSLHEKKILLYDQNS